MNGMYERNFDFTDYLVNTQKDTRTKTGVNGNNIAIFLYLGINDSLTATDNGCVITQSIIGKYGTGQYNQCVYGA